VDQAQTTQSIYFDGFLELNDEAGISGVGGSSGGHGSDHSRGLPDLLLPAMRDLGSVRRDMLSSRSPYA
jgi:hypothetical protein